MLDLRVLRDNLKTIREALKKRGKEEAERLAEQAVRLDERRRGILVRVEELKALRNKASKQIPAMKQNGEDVLPLMAEMKQTADQIKVLDEEVRVLDEELRAVMLSIPNRPDASVPEGTDETQNVVVRTWGEPTRFDFAPKAHWDIGEELGVIDPETAAKVAGARFMFYMGTGARLERSVMNLMLNVHSTEHGYLEVIPPLMVNEASMYGTGQLPKFAGDAYRVEGTDFYMIPTAEVPVTNMYRDSVLDEAELPLCRVAGTACFRSEAGSAGRDTRGLIRQHQFNKVELVKFAHPENSYDELETLTADAERILQLLELPYRVVLLCGGDLGFASAKTYDIEVWMPSYGRYVEISSCSNYEDFQARRANIRYRGADGKLRFVHTLNGSGLAVGRTVAAIIENYQQADGSVKVPEALKVYFAGEAIRGVREKL